MGRAIFYLFHANLHAFLIRQRIWALRAILIDNKIKSFVEKFGNLIFIVYRWNASRFLNNRLGLNFNEISKVFALIDIDVGMHICNG